MSKRKLKSRILLLLGSALAMGSVFLLMLFCKINTERLLLLHESKNIEVSLRLLAAEYYGEDRLIYDPLTSDGLAGGVWERVAKLSGAEGTMVLGSWDKARGGPASFIYMKDDFVVFYRYDGEDENCWDVYYHIKSVKTLRWTVKKEKTAKVQ